MRRENNQATGPLATGPLASWTYISQWLNQYRFRYELLHCYWHRLASASVLVSRIGEKGKQESITNFVKHGPPVLTVNKKCFPKLSSSYERVNTDDGYDRPQK